MSHANTLNQISIHIVVVDRVEVPSVEHVMVLRIVTRMIILIGISLCEKSGLTYGRANAVIKHPRLSRGNRRNGK